MAPKLKGKRSPLNARGQRQCGINSTESGPSHAPCRDEQLARLMDMFPEVDPAVLIAAFDGCGGDAALAAVALCNEEVPSLPVDLPTHLVTSPPAHEDSRTHSLIVLLEQFDSLDPKVVGRTFEKEQYNRAATVRQLRRLVEEQHRLDEDSDWSRLSVAERLSLDNLQKSFIGKVPSRAIQSTFLLEGCDVERAVATLRLLVNEGCTGECKGLQCAPTAPPKIEKMAPRQRVGGGVVDVSLMYLKGEPTGGDGAPPHTTTSFVSETSLYRTLLSKGPSGRSVEDLRAEALSCKRQRNARFDDARLMHAKGNQSEAQRLSRSGNRLDGDYKRLNILAMQELERTRCSPNNPDELDLHYFYLHEALDVLLRRLRVCKEKSVGSLRVVTGVGTHTLMTSIQKEMLCEPFLSLAEIRKVDTISMILSVKRAT